MKKRTLITIGRQFGSGGREVGFKLAQKLGIKCYDKEILSLAAKESGLCEQIFETHDEKPNNSFLYSLVMDTYSMGYSSPGFIDMPINQKVFLAQFEAIKKLASEESCIIVGRCADYALEDNPNLVSVFVHAELNYRIDRIANKYSLSKDKAKDIIIKTDKSRASYYNYYTNKKWSSVNSYHLSIDSSQIGIDNAVDLINYYVNFN